MAPGLSLLWQHFLSDLQIVVFWQNGHPGREETRPSQQDGTGQSAHYTA
jgi:hypothetical protein